MKLVRFCCFAVTLVASLVLLTNESSAQVNLPFQITSGSGIVPQLPTPDSPVQPHNITAGTAMFNGESFNYTGSGTVTALGAIDPATGQVPFASGEPFLFDFGGGNTLRMHYGHPEVGAPSAGTATISPLPSGLVDVTWLATFNPIPGSGTGKFANVTGGSIFMTAKQTSVNPLGPDLPYSWSSDVGYLTVVPEPSTGLLLALVGCGLLARRGHGS